ncbi:MAG TPA: branched-chain amino acid aminotransferase [Vicinamibacterales bacterium]
MATHTIDIVRTTSPRPRPDESQLGFGKYFADHMLLLEYDAASGWADPRIVPYGPLMLDPAASVLHYGQAMFEGLKAFRQQNGRIALFRVDDNLKRLANGAPRLSMPVPDLEVLRDAIVTLVAADRDWVPSLPGTALYVRPVLIGTEPFLGVRPSSRYLLYVITSPVGAYYQAGLKPVKIWVETEAVRAVKGGIGWVKAAANYVASMKTADDVRARGYEQVLWLDAIEHRYVEEVGTMNLCVVIGDELATPPLGGSILPGITRDSVLTLAREWGMKVSERPIAFDELLEAHRKGTLREVFGCGTAAVISAVGELGHRDGTLRINNGETGPVAQRLYDAITDIQYGRIPDRHGWLTYCD